MNTRLLELVVVRSLYALLCGLRLLFLSGRAGAITHNFLYYWLFKTFSNESEHRKLLDMLRFTLRGPKNNGVLKWQRRVYTAHPHTVRHALENVFIRRFFIAGSRRKQLTKQGFVIPSVVMISVNTPETCNLACTTCYAIGHEKTAIPLELAKKVIREQEDLGIFNVRLLGGEPFLYRHIEELFRAFPRTTFYVATNATRFTPELVERLANFGNVFPMISLEGFQKTTDAIRGLGTFAKVTNAMRLCKDAGLPYSVTVTVAKNNIAEATSPSFLSMLDELGSTAVGFSCYVPMGRDPHPEWQISVEESENLDKVRGMFYRDYGMYPAIGRNGVGRVNACSAASEYIHILPNGEAESCPFAAWATPGLNVRDHTLLEIMGSRFFEGIREINGFGIAGAAPCHANQLQTLQAAFVQLGAQPTTTATSSRRM